MSVPLAVASGLGYDHATAPDDYPVQSPTGMEAARFCDWLGGRLPTVEEWEYAARGTDGRPFPWGYELPDQDTIRVNTFVGGRSWAEHPVAVDDPDFARGSTPEGIMHLIGNVAEWTRSPASCDAGDCTPWTYGEPPPDALQVMGHSYATGTLSESVLEKDPKLLLSDPPNAPAYPVEVIGFRCVYPAANP